MTVRRTNRLFITTIAAGAIGLFAVSMTARAEITGSVKLEGKAPEAKEIDMSGVADCKNQHADPVYEETVITGDKGELKNVIVALKPDDPAALGGEVPSEPLVLDQKGCMYTPHVAAVMVGQKMVVKNDDPFLHNVHSLAQQNPAFNVQQPNKDEGKEVESPKVKETFKIKCEVHPWMGAWIGVFEHPYFAVSGEDGKFTIKGNPPDGDYTVVAWHEKYGTKEGKVTVKDGKGTVDFSFDAGSADAGEPTIGAKLASITATKTLSCCEQPDKAKALTASAAAGAPAK